MGLASMNAPSPAVPKGLGAPQPFGSSAPGSGAQTGGYNAALQQLGNSLNASNNTTAGQQMQLGNQLQQQQGNLQQSLMSRGLGNTTAALSMQQAPIQSYNLGMAQVGDLNAMRQMSAYQNLAGMYAQGGQQIAQMDQPYAQTQYVANTMHGLYGNQPTQAPAFQSPVNQPPQNSGSDQLANSQALQNYFHQLNMFGGQGGTPGQQMQPGPGSPGGQQPGYGGANTMQISGPGGGNGVSFADQQAMADQFGGDENNPFGGM